MRGLIWNCRGIKKSGVSTFLNNLIFEHKFHFIGLQETQQADIDDKTIRLIDPAGNYLWKWIPSKGKSGGILSGINTDIYDVGSFHEGKYILQLNIFDRERKLKWNFLNVYGAPQEENKIEFLTELASFCSKNKDPYLVGGDFNILRFTSEKNKGGGIHRHSGVFNSIIAAQELIDIHMAGGKFTWSNNQNNPTLERLDRILISKDWEDLYPGVMLYKLPREVSDHNPLILTDGASKQLSKLSFRFELSWIKHPDFLHIVQILWEKPCHANSALDTMQIKLKRFKQFFKGWGFNVRG